MSNKPLDVSDASIASAWKVSDASLGPTVHLPPLPLSRLL
jgi:hypothetical protein